MIKTVESFFIHTVKRSPNPFTIYHTVWIGGQTIHATIALSGISQGIISRDAAGDVAAYIKRWGHFVAPGDEHEEDPPGSPERNEIRIDGCTFITFGLTAEMAEGFAVGTIYYFA